MKGSKLLQKGFTLIEVVLVIAIIGLMATLLLTLINPNQQFKKSNDARRKADMHQIQAVLELYRADVGQYPAIQLDCGAPLMNGTTIYMQKIPCDPKNSDPSGKYKYVYTYTAATNSYTLIDCLENVSDPDKDGTNNAAICTGGTTNWSYTLTNP